MSDERIGDYVLGTVLGRGTVGTVYRAVHHKTGEAVALKVLLPQVSEDEDIVARFNREIEILERLSHPNVIALHSWGRHKGQLYYTMELVEGGTLKQLLRNKISLQWQDAVEIGWQVCSALQHLHNHGVIHRDLKPANLFFADDGTVKLGDFGIALDTGATELTQSGLTVGTYMYMSPEQIRGERAIGPKTDIYALGCLIYEMVTGRPPFQGENFAQIFDQHLQTPPPPISIYDPSIPEELDDLVQLMLKKNPEKRPFNARTVQGMLAEVTMKWDESNGKRESKRKSRQKPDIWAIERRKPILAELIRETRPADVRTPSWLMIAVIVLVAILLATLGQFVS
ncbi:serine/threonine protein kinase [Stratiformator vulcanicus]|uniref:non-specific serine/threonine protein kinase n=1 Tax=Stratiformator vulcanicus TaxID=2527980 RepID=A0A517R6W3_9PLAN|nr:serine/threonine-protein kinase [Stratiformator vulcanicus]QDT39637.1 Serine/threonine-protein kinase StkP [Stratiformator vulcanicus]